VTEALTHAETARLLLHLFCWTVVGGGHILVDEGGCMGFSIALFVAGRAARRTTLQTTVIVSVRHPRPLRARWREILARNQRIIMVDSSVPGTSRCGIGAGQSVVGM